MGITKRENDANQRINPCKEKPIKPIRLEGQTFDQYRATNEHKQYREKMKIWKACVSPITQSKRYDTQNIITEEKDDPCGEKPIKPIRLDNTNKYEYKKSTEFINYQKKLKLWKACMSPMGISKRYEESISK